MLLVVAFHAGLPVPGGFVGVDVFFVISGFVITGMIQREHSSTGRFRFGRFYLRRFKRLTPALALMVVVTMALAFWLLSPFGAQQQTAQTGAGAMLLVANFVIAKNTGGSFALPVESNPLIHTWSLSVEEQFYLIFPAILLLGWALSQRGRRLLRIVALVCIAALVSFWLAMAVAWAHGYLGPGAFPDLFKQFCLIFPAVLLLGWVFTRRIPWIRARQIPWVTTLVGTAALMSLWLAMIGTNALGPSPAKYLVGYYAPVARVWEFAVGALLALAATSRCLRSDKRARLFAWLGVALLAGSAWLINGIMSFPGPWTLLPVGGTLLLIAAGTHHSTWVSRALALPPIVKIGDWSYSIYLWHWPLKAFATTVWPEAHYAGTVAAFLSILPAAASYRWIEQPIRRLPR